jgi:lysophospholipase L1-like esterase
MIKSILLTLGLMIFPLLNAQNQEKQQGNELFSPQEQDKIKNDGDYRLNNDWAFLTKFHDENAKLAPPAKGEQRVVFMGNSITEGWSNLNPEFFEGKPYINRGISGQTTPQMLLRFRQDVIELKPKVVLINAGVNDIAGNTGHSTLDMIEDNLTSMVELAKVNGITVILASVIPAFDFPWKPGMQPAAKIVALNSWIKSYAAQNHLIYLDYFTAMADERMGLKAALTYDGVHPNKEGYTIMGPLAEKAIADALKQK